MYIVFTDIDGTLLDHNTYSYEKSLPGISILKEKNVPLVMVSSKTFDEMKLLHQELTLDSPFVFENGGGIARLEGGEYDYEIIGEDIDKLIKMRDLISDVMECKIKLLPEMTIQEIVDYTGLSQEKARFSTMRKASLPFVMLEDKKIGVKNLNIINETMKKDKLFITKGGRFFHCSSIGSNKGNAMKRVLDIYKEKNDKKKIITVALGDSENDIPMLNLVDFPFLVRKHDGSVIETGNDKIKITQEIGPTGFTEAMKKIFS